MKARRLEKLGGAVLCAALCMGPVAVMAGVIVGTGAAPSRTSLGATDAVGYSVSESNPGHSLMFPYFTVQGGQMSVLHLVNTDSQNGKLVKLRFRGAGNGDSLLSFLVLLSPADVWTGAITAGADGLAQLTTSDNTCTFPTLTRGIAQPFKVDRLNPAWSQSVLNNNTREGAVEAVLAADIPSARVYGAQGNERSKLYEAIRLLSGAAPCTATEPSAAFLGDLLTRDIAHESDAASNGLATPSGGLAGTWYIIDVPGSTTFSGAAKAVRAVNGAGKTARGNFVLFPQTDAVVGQPELYTSDPLLVSAGFSARSKDAAGSTSAPTTAQVIEAKFHDLPDLSTPYYLPPSNPNARKTAGDLSKLLETTTIFNQYAVDASISAKTDWILSMPTKRYSVGYDYSQPAESASVFSVVGADRQYFFSSGAGRTIANNATQVCSQHDGYRDMDREGTISWQVPVATAPSTAILNCGVVSLLAFGTGPSTFSSSVSRHNLTSVFANGWMSIPTVNGAPDSGLPIIGGAFIKLTNPGARPGIAGNYGISYPHLTSQ
ncbi:surface layer protein NpdA [Acidovorax sp.]|uniref:surface layer protein NpdA n=1 Tax=Acidovorax sp. TaxID=1872122 RepID=UPI0026369F27|nr:surface layer protein NpdA [Acidovorax sp.]